MIGGLCAVDIRATRMIALMLVTSCVAGLVSVSPGWAHGGVSMDSDVCVLTAGAYRAHFTGYQPERRASQEFCEDIPEVSRAIIVLDYIDRPLRDMAVDFRIIRDIDNIGNSATYADLGGSEQIEAATIFYEPPKVYNAGTITAEHDFVASGRYIGILTATHLETGDSVVSVFPFAVGVTNYMTYLPAALGIIAVLGSAYYISERKRRGESGRTGAQSSSDKDPTT